MLLRKGPVFAEIHDDGVDLQNLVLVLIDAHIRGCAHRGLEQAVGVPVLAAPLRLHGHKVKTEARPLPDVNDELISHQKPTKYLPDEYAQTRLSIMARLVHHGFLHDSRLGVESFGAIVLTVVCLG